MLAKAITPEGDLIQDAFHIGPFLDGAPGYLVCDAEVFRPILVEEDFPKLPISYEAVKILIGGGLVVSRGEAWRKQRANLSPLFHYSKLKQMPDVMVCFSYARSPFLIPLG